MADEFDHAADGDLVENIGRDASIPPEVLDAVRTLLRWAGDSPEREGLHDTPGRVARAMLEWGFGAGEHACNERHDRAAAVFLAAFVISSTFAFTVDQRRRDLALLRLVGGSRRQVRRLLLGEAFLLGLAGAALGVPVIAAGFALGAAQRPPDVI